MESSNFNVAWCERLRRQIIYMLCNAGIQVFHHAVVNCSDTREYAFQLSFIKGSEENYSKIFSDEITKIVQTSKHKKIWSLYVYGPFASSDNTRLVTWVSWGGYI